MQLISRPITFVLTTFLFHAVCTQTTRADESAKLTRKQIAFFETKVRPLLADNCFKCHGPKKQKGKLRLDSRRTLLGGGETGPAIVPRKPNESLLIEAINYKSLEMPPSGKLTDRQIAILTEWVSMGAPWPNEKRVRAVTADGEFQITQDDLAYWAFQPIRKPSVPTVKRATASPIDAFIQTRLDSKGLNSNPAAGRRVLIRRAFFDSIGLPPTPDEVKRFVDADSPVAFEKLIDELLNRPQYGERWGRHWLDVVRFGQTNGYERDDEKPNAWRYRDYVISSFNDDKPFDRFIKEQLAGDELDDVSHETIIATGFYRVGIWDDEPAEKTLALYDEMDDLVRVTGAAFLGVTVGCARCHNHMFDPISQQDYYEFVAFFKNVAPFGRDKGGASETHWELNPDAVYTPLTSAKEVADWKARESEIQNQIEQKKKEVEKATDAQKSKLAEEIKKLEENLKKAPYQLALSVREPNAKPQPTHLLIRGNPRNKGKVVEPAVLQIIGNAGKSPSNDVAVSKLSGETRKILTAVGVKPTSGRRRRLADWIASVENPLTARVIVNRVWQHLFGRGIVRTPNNFGKAGVPPTHPQLLDWLTAEFVEGGWKIRPLIKTIMLSRPYQMSSSAQNADAAKLDPGNDLFWRHNLRRLDAEAIRDAVLSVSGQLNLKMGGRGFFPNLSADVLATQSRPGSGWDKSDPAERNRRSVYIFVKRTLMVPMLETFDYNNTAEPLGVRPVTTVAPQALMLLNGQFIEEKAESFAARVKKDVGDDRNAQIERVFQLALNRKPSDNERSIATQIMKRQSESSALKSLCLVVFNTNEFVYLD